MKILQRPSAAFRHFRFSLLIATVVACSPLRAQVASPVDRTLATDIVRKQLAAFAQDNHAFRYLLKRSDAKGAVTRIEIVTPFGRVGRTIARDGKPLTAEQHAAEKARLDAFIHSPSDQKKKMKAEASGRKMSDDLTNAMPSAMIYTLRPGQPQLARYAGRQKVIDFTPNPDFHPSSTAQEALRGVAGTLWVDEKTHFIVRIEARSIHDINFLLGIVAKVHAGATFEADTRQWMPGKLAYSKINIDASVRELLFKTQHFRSSEQSTDYVQLKDGLTLAEAAQMLIDMPAESR